MNYDGDREGLTDCYQPQRKKRGAPKRKSTFEVAVTCTRIVDGYTLQYVRESINRCFKQWGYKVKHLTVTKIKQGKG